MDFKFLLKVIFALAVTFSYSAYGQGGSPAIMSAVRFEQYPVQMSTGLALVSLPLYSMPSHAKDININMSLHYHQSSIAKKGLRSGNCGRGWNLAVGGVVQRESMDASVYSFSFNGFSGKLTAVPVMPSSAVDVKITENGGAKIYAEAVSNGSKITSFTFYDDKGYKYVFSVIDTYHIKQGSVYVPVNTSFQLTDIYDTNRHAGNQNQGNLLAHFQYIPYEESLKYEAGVYKTNIVNLIDIVTVPGIGSITLTSDPRHDGDGLWFLYTGAQVKDFLGNGVRSFDFGTDLQYDLDSRLYNVNLSTLSEYGTSGTSPLVHRFFYRPVVNNNNDFTGIYKGEDKWGYYNTYDKYCGNDNGLPTTSKMLEGVLEKIQYPAGGCVIYAYESNTYSYNEGVRMDETSPGVTNPAFYTDLSIPENRHNFSYPNVATALNTDFTISTETEMYVKVYGSPEFVPQLGGYVSPTYYLVNAATNAIISSISLSSIADNNCLGWRRILQPGTYKITKSGSGYHGTLKAYSVKPLTSPRKWWYGGGLRVSAVGYFDYDAPQDYFTVSDPFAAAPAKASYFSYTDFNDSTLSSGSISSFAGSDYAPVIYSNVSVKETTSLFQVNPARTEYSFYAPSDFIGLGLSSSSDYRLGRMKGTKVYNSDNELQKEVAYTYDSITSDSSGSETDLYTMGWMVLKQKLVKEYLGSTLQTKEDYEYDINRNLKKMTVSTSRSTALISNYYYHLDVNGNPFITNRYGLLDHVDEFLGADQLNTIKIDYSTNWLNTTGSIVNSAYLPQQISHAKGGASTEVFIKNNLYDQYGNVLEAEEVNRTKISYIWGYNDTVIVAEIRGVAYANIPQALIDAVKLASNGGSEQNLLAALANLRNHPQVAVGKVTTTTYKPLIGVSTVTDERGYKISYEYDPVGRITVVKDMNGNILKEDLYNTPSQN